MSYDAVVIRRLLKRASNAERPVVENLALADGILWRCRLPSCAHLNDDNLASCVKCGRSRKP